MGTELRRIVIHSHKSVPYLTCSLGRNCLRFDFFLEWRIYWLDPRARPAPLPLCAAFIRYGHCTGHWPVKATKHNKRPERDDLNTPFQNETVVCLGQYWSCSPLKFVFAVVSSIVWAYRLDRQFTSVHLPRAMYSFISKEGTCQKRGRAMRTEYLKKACPRLRDPAIGLPLAAGVSSLYYTCQIGLALFHYSSMHDKLTTFLSLARHSSAAYLIARC